MMKYANFSYFDLIKADFFVSWVFHPNYKANLFCSKSIVHAYDGEVRKITITSDLVEVSLQQGDSLLGYSKQMAVWDEKKIVRNN